MDTEIYARHGRFVAELGAPLIELLHPKCGERILDLGCGDGALTAKLAESGATVVGVDASPEQVTAARARGVDARVMAGERLEFSAEFDAVFTNAALHWMQDIDAVLESVAHALRAGGRFAGEFGGHANIAAIRVALIAALSCAGIDAEQRLRKYFPTAEEWRRRLEAHGFFVDEISWFPRPTPLPTGMEGWLETFALPAFWDLPEAERRALKQEVIRLTRPVLCDREGNWMADYMRIRFAAHLRGGG